MERRLAAILAADVVGYSRLMGVDEAGTLALLRRHRAELIDTKSRQYRGRTVKLMGDGALLEFASAVDSITFAAEVQVAMRQRNAGVLPARQIVFRIGINLGEIISEDGDIFGDGVNVAARLEALADPGGICISSAVLDQVRGRVDLSFEDLGEKALKNIDRLVHIYRVVLNEKAEALLTPVPARMPAGKLRPWHVVAGAGSLCLVLGAATWFQSGHVIPFLPDPTAAALPALPDKPSVAVLPFDNLSGDPAQGYFADGISEDLTTDLSKLGGLFVIARHSAFQYRGNDLALDVIGRELGVRFVLRGSVMRMGDDIRINAQLVDATTGGNVWAERYHGRAESLFTFQDKVAAQIVSALSVNLTPTEVAAQKGGETTNLAAHDAFLQGWAYYQRFTPDDFAQAIPFLERAVELDPDYGRAYAALAAIYWASVEKNVTGRGGSWDERMGLSHEAMRWKGDAYLRKALRNPTPLAFQVSANVLSYQGRFEEAVAEAERAIALDPNDAIGHQSLAKTLVFAGRPTEAEAAISKAMRLNPLFPSEYLTIQGLAQFGQEHFAQAARTLGLAVERNPDDDTALILLAAALGHEGQVQEASRVRATLDTLRQNRREAIAALGPSKLKAGIDGYLQGPYALNDVDLWPFRLSVDRERLRVGLAKAGVPESAGVEAESPVTVEGAITVDAAQAKALFDRQTPFIDVRTIARWNLGHVPNATLLDLETAFTPENLLARAGREDAVVIYCEGSKCLRSSDASRRAVDWGYQRIYYFRDGFPAWRAAGYPIAHPPVN
jgi:TolB-like protein/class 3 adenylate cyclase/Flp pilus assembly protein TadD/rhodanese-related sulfurtransferase